MSQNNIRELNDDDLRNVLVHEIGHGTNNSTDIHINYRGKAATGHGGAPWLPGGSKSGVYDKKSAWWGPGGFL